MKKWREKRRRGEQRRGVAVVELAMILPVLALIVFATIEATGMIFLQQSLKIAAYEGVRVSLVPGSEEGNVQGAVNQILTDRRIQGGSVTVEPADFETAPLGTYINVTVSAPCDQNNLLPSWFYGGKTLTATAEMMKEN